MIDPVARIVQWTDVEGRAFELVVPDGMQVAANLKAFFLANREAYVGLLAAGVALSEFVVVNLDGAIVARGCAAPGDDANDLAWLSCMFMEHLQGRLGWVMPNV